MTATLPDRLPAETAAAGQDAGQAPEPASDAIFLPTLVHVSAAAFAFQEDVVASLLCQHGARVYSGQPCGPCARER